jgi:hypothetical protein
MAVIERVSAGRGSAGRRAEPCYLRRLIYVWISRGAMEGLNEGGANTDKCPGTFYILKLTNC